MPKIISQKRFINEALEAHNKYRKLHDAPPLELDSNLTEIALEWAENLAENESLEYSNSVYKNEPVGQNILRAKTKYLAGDKVADEWYKEEALYSYDGKFSPNTGHFTQMVWKNTKKVGFAFATTDDDRFYVVVNYYPAGNYKNEFNLNVLKPKDFNPLPAAGYSNNVKPLENKSNSHLVNLILKEKNENISRNATQDLNESFEVSDHENDDTHDDSYDDDDPKERFIREALNTHNLCRKKHGVDPLRHNPELSKIAQNYANYLASIGRLSHSSNAYKSQQLGENLAMSFDQSSNHFSGEQATMNWYNEVNNHRFGEYQSGTGHFTQVVWKGTKEVGFGVSKAKNGAFYVVANYFPAGNLLGTFSQNVKRPFN